MPDIYDAAKYDAIHNQHLGLDLRPVYKARAPLATRRTRVALEGTWEQSPRYLPCKGFLHKWGATATLTPASHPHPSGAPLLTLLFCLLQTAKALAAAVIPNEYGIHPAGKLRIGSMICSQVGGRAGGCRAAAGEWRPVAPSVGDRRASVQNEVGCCAQVTGGP